MKKIGDDYPFFNDVNANYSANCVRNGKVVDLSSAVVINMLLVADIYVKQKGIFFGLYDSNGFEILPSEYDNWFKLEEEGIVIFRKTNLSKKDSDSRRYMYGFLNVNTKNKTNCRFNKYVKLFPGLYDAEADYIKHYLVKSDCKESDYYKSIKVVNNKIVILKGWSEATVVNKDGDPLFKDMYISVEDFEHGQYAGAIQRSESYIVDDDGIIVRKLPYKKIGSIRSGYFPVSDGLNWGYSDLEGRLVVPCKYLSAGPIDKEGYVYIQKSDFLNKMWGATKIKFSELIKQS